MIKENVQKILVELPKGMELVAAAKEREPEEILEAIEAGVKIVGENYIGKQKSLSGNGKKNELVFYQVPKMGKHDLLRKSTLEMFDMIETVDSLEIAVGIDKRCREMGKMTPVLIEINSGREPQKSGVLPEAVQDLIKEISSLRDVK